METHEKLCRTLPAPVLALALGACQCIDIPESDAVAPRPTVTVIYQDPYASGYQEVTAYVDTESENSDRTVTLPEAWPFQLFWHASDDGGVRELVLEEVFTPPPDETGTGSVSQPLYAHPAMPSGDFSVCAKAYRALSVDWTPWSGQYEFRLTAVDFHDNERQTPRLVIRQE